MVLNQNKVKSTAVLLCHSAEVLRLVVLLLETLQCQSLDVVAVEQSVVPGGHACGLRPHHGKHGLQGVLETGLALRATVVIL